MRPFRDLADFLRRTRAELPAAESLIRIGALDGLGVTEAGRPPTRDELLALLPEIKAVLAREGVAGDDTLCLAPAPVRPAEDASHVSGWSAARRLSAELELVGLSLTATRSRLRARDLEARGVTWARDLRALPDRTRVRVAGVRERAQTPRTRSGKRTCFLTLEDPTGLLDVVVFPDALERSGEVIVKHRAYLVDGTLQNNCERGLAIVADVVRPYVVRTGSRRPRAAAPRRAERPDGTGARRSGRAGRGELGGGRSGARGRRASRVRGLARVPAVRIVAGGVPVERRRGLELAPETHRAVAELLANGIETANQLLAGAAATRPDLVRQARVSPSRSSCSALSSKPETPTPSRRNPMPGDHACANELAGDRTEDRVVVGGSRRACGGPSWS